MRWQLGHFMALPPIDTRYSGVVSDSLTSKPVDPNGAASAGSGSVGRLFLGQILEVTVVRASASELWLQSANHMLRAAAPPMGAVVGERLLLKVLDPTTTPPRLKLLSDDELPASLIASLGPAMRSLLFRQESLGPTQAFLQQLLTAGGLKFPSAQVEQPRELLQRLIGRLDGIDAEQLKKWLERSGLFGEGRQRLQSGVQVQDLKSLLVSLMGQEGVDSQLLHGALEGLVSSQIKALDAQLNGNLFYNFLLPFLGQGFIEAQIQQTAAEMERDQYRVNLRHNSAELGQYVVDILLYKRRVTLLFKSDQKWVVDAINSNQQRLVDAVAEAGLTAERISAVLSKADRPDPYSTGTLDPSIFDLKV